MRVRERQRVGDLRRDARRVHIVLHQFRHEPLTRDQVDHTDMIDAHEPPGDHESQPRHAVDDDHRPAEQGGLQRRSAGSRPHQVGCVNCFIAVTCHNRNTDCRMFERRGDFRGVDGARANTEELNPSLLGQADGGVPHHRQMTAHLAVAAAG